MKKLLLVLAAVFLFGKSEAQWLNNDFCSTAQPVTVGAACTQGSNALATLNNDFNMSCGDATDAAVWFSFVAPGTGAVIISTDHPATNFDTHINVLGAAPGDPTVCPVAPNMFEYGCDDDGGTGSTSLLQVNGLVAGQTYYIQLDGFAAATGTYCIDIQSVPCTANAGTFTITATGGNVNIIANTIYTCEDVVSCYDITSNNDYTLPTSVFYPVPGCFTVPELMYAIYINTAPNTNPADPDNDPGWPGIYWTGQDFNDCDPSLFAPTILPGDVVYLVPITVDDGDNDANCGGLQTDGDGDGCYAVGQTITVVYLTSTVAVQSAIDLCAGTVDVTITGGMPLYDGSDYTITNTGSGTLTGAPITSGGTVVVTGLLNGQNWSLSITDQNGCPETINGTYTGTVPTITGAISVCVGSATQLTGSAPTGGSGWSSTNTGIAIVSGTGLVTGVTAGTSDITYTDGNGCPVIETVTVNPLPVANVPSSNAYCPGDAVPLGALTSTPVGATFAWTNSNTSIGLGGAGTGNVPAFSATNATGAAISGTITV
ncbi:MAG: Ig-like domain-containing protein, partial [Lentisphaeria bacterium]|nr:Ig-like domain-containing protein [Lentisphaeria bacterium]